MKQVLLLFCLGFALSGCAALLAGAFGSSVVVDQCVEKEAEICEEVNDILQL